MRKLLFTLLVTITALSAPVTHAQEAFNNAFQELQKAAPKNLDTESSLPAQIGTMINVVFGVLGLIALIVMIHGGLTFLLGAGNPDKIQKAKKELLYAGIGLVVILSAIGISNFVVRGILN